MESRTSALAGVAGSLLGIGFTIAGFSAPFLGWPVVALGVVLIVSVPLVHLRRWLLTKVYAGPAIGGSWWMRDWRHENETKDKEKTVSHDAVLKQVGSQVSGDFTNSQGAYKVIGVIQDRVFTGTWTQVTTKGGHDPWHGAFQFLISPGHEDSITMRGRWVGFDGDRVRINCGEWEWCRPGRLFPSEKV